MTSSQSPSTMVDMVLVLFARLSLAACRRPRRTVGSHPIRAADRITKRRPATPLAGVHNDDAGGGDECARIGLPGAATG
jgi:hypothetical protein